MFKFPELDRGLGCVMERWSRDRPVGTRLRCATSGRAPALRVGSGRHDWLVRNPQPP